MRIFKRWVWPVMAGFLVESIIMLLFELDMFEKKKRASMAA